MRHILHTLSSVLLAGLASAVAIPAVAQEKDEPKAEEDLDLVKLLNVKVSTATKTSESLDDAPAVITVVTREDIHRWGYRNVGEALSHCVGFYMVDDHALPNAGVRGMTGGLGAESGVIKVMIDGRSVAYRTTSGNWLGAELIPLESVQQIEILRGPASALYGADAFLGVVNIITVPPEQLRPLRARVFAGVSGANPSGQGDMVVGGKTGNFDYMLGASGEYGSRSGLRLPAESPNPTLPNYLGDRRTANNLDRRSLGLQARVGYRVPEVGHVIASSYFSGYQRGGDFSSWAQLTNGTTAEGRSVGTVLSEGQMRFNIDALLHAAKGFDLALQSTYFEGGVLPGDRIEVGSDLWYAKRRTWYRGVDSMVEARIFPSERFNVIFGAEGVFDHEAMLAPKRYVTSTDTAVATAGVNNRRVDLLNLGAYVSSNLRVIDPWLKLTGGFRYDNHSTYGSQFTGRFGATSRWSKSVVAKLLYGSAFKAPSPYLLYASPLRPGDVQGNVNLKPQKIHTVEYQMSWKPNGFFGVSSGVSLSWLLDKAEFSPQGINLVARNAASQTSLAWETRADVKYYDTISAYASAELVQSYRDLGAVGYAAQLIGSRNIVYPPYIGRLGAMLGVPLFPALPLSAGAEGSLVGPRRAADTSVLANGTPFSLPAYVLVNVSVMTGDLYLFPGHESRLALRGYNVIGTKGPDPGFAGFEYPLAPREIFLELRHMY